jgi:2-iminobutanoate/2-iminopropanoate deaminase
MMGEAEIMTRQEFRVDGLSEPLSHYTDAVRFGDILFVSGIAPLDERGALVGEDAAAQTRQICLNLQRILEAAGASFADILKVTVFLTDVSDRTKINPVRQEFFGNARPASTLIGVRELAVPGMRVEIEAVVGLRGRSEG